MKTLLADTYFIANTLENLSKEFSWKLFVFAPTLGRIWVSGSSAKVWASTKGADCSIKGIGI
jgi:hypothetical protein